jgi:Tol biopolymer transport system component
LATLRLALHVCGRYASVVIRASLLCAVLLTLCAATAEAAFPGKPGPIVYTKTDQRETGEGEITSSGGLFVDPPGRRRHPRQLTFNRTDSEPAFSPDGRRIVFFSVGAEGPGIYVVGIDGSGRRLVIEGGGAPSFFPSGRAIVFSRSEGRDSHIYSVRLDGSGLRQLTRGPYEDHDPVVSPNGRRIAFVSDRDPDERRDRSDIFSMRPNGSQLRVLIDGPRRERAPDYAPDGRRIAFVRGGVLHSSILVARANGRGVRLLTPCRQRSRIRCASYSQPAFSPDGRQIAVWTGGSRSSSILTIGSRDRGTGRSVDSGGIEEEGFGSHVSSPTWGPRPR